MPSTPNAAPDPATTTGRFRAMLRPLVDEAHDLAEQTLPISFVDPTVTIRAAEQHRGRARQLHARLAALVDGATTTRRTRRNGGG